MRRILIVTLLTVLCVASLARPVMTASALGNTAPEAQSTPDTALQKLASMLGFVYAGDCAATRSPEDIGRLCTTFVDEQSRVRAYIAGRTFSEYSLWLFVREAPAGWQPAGHTPLDFLAPALDPPWPAGP